MKPYEYLQKKNRKKKVRKKNGYKCERVVTSRA